MKPTTARRLVLLPGLGADGRLFDPQRAEFPEIEVPAWLPYREEESLAAYAGRMAETIAPSAGMYLGGVSFGGMVALEMARRLGPRAVFLIASGRTGQALAPHLRYFGEFAHAFPQREFGDGAGLSRLYVRKFGKLTPAQEAFYAEMLADTRPAFVRWGIAAIPAWPGPGELPMPVYHIHGSDDELIPLAGVQPDEVVPGGGHLLNVTHAAEVNAFIGAHLLLS
jgi:pimeloyl-ACP methyl ester carboxylesterase